MGVSVEQVLRLGGKSFDLNTPFDISLGISFDQSLKAYGVDNPKCDVYKVDGFTGSVEQGGSCNCYTVAFNSHCHTTHTECVSHLLTEVIPISEFMKPFFTMTQLVSVDAGPINANDLKSLNSDPNISALVIRSQPNPEEKKSRAYQNNAPFLTKDAVNACLDASFDHLLVDFPSIDPMVDQGRLIAHRQFWGMEEGQVQITPSTQTHRSITELVYVPNGLSDGLYALNLQWIDMALDAAPSRPILYPEVAV